MSTVRVVQHLSQEYAKGERPTPLEIRDNESRLNRSEALPKWHVTITPSMGTPSMGIG